jgi:hypothetical protein
MTADFLLAAQEASYNLFNTKLHCIICNRPPIDSKLSRLNPFHHTIFFEIHFNIILLYTLKTSKWSLLFKLSNLYDVGLAIISLWSTKLILFYVNAKLQITKALIYIHVVHFDSFTYSLRQLFTIQYMCVV